MSRRCEDHGGTLTSSRECANWGVSHMLRSIAGFVGSFAILASLMVATPAAVVADDTSCRGEMRGYYDDVYVPYGAFCKLVGATVEGDIDVKGRASLVAIDSDVDGNIQGDYAKKIVVRDSNIEGNIQAKKTAFVKVAKSFVDGDVQADYAKRVVVLGSNIEGNIQATKTGFMKVAKSFVDGDVQAEYVRKVMVLWSRVYGNIQVDHAKLVRLVGNDVGGDIQVDKSFFSHKDSFVNRNKVEGNVQVFENRVRFSIYGNRIYGDLQCKDNFPPPVGGNNMVEGDKEDQCRRF
jgi:cytoskeletal protein CcmA (bactofilin family)